MTEYKTEQRKRLLDLFGEHPMEAFSAKQIAVLLGNDVSISAVYRNLAELEEKGLLKRCSKQGLRESFYEYVGDADCKQHLHLSCTKCGKIIHMDASDTDLCSLSVSKYKNFELDRSETVLYGVCGDCQKK